MFRKSHALIAILVLLITMFVPAVSAQDREEGYCAVVFNVTEFSSEPGVLPVTHQTHEVEFIDDTNATDVFFMTTDGEFHLLSGDDTFDLDYIDHRTNAAATASYDRSTGLFSTAFGNESRLYMLAHNGNRIIVTPTRNPCVDMPAGGWDRSDG